MNSNKKGNAAKAAVKQKGKDALALKPKGKGKAKGGNAKGGSPAEVPQATRAEAKSDLPKSSGKCTGCAPAAKLTPKGKGRGRGKGKSADKENVAPAESDEEADNEGGGDSSSLMDDGL